MCRCCIEFSNEGDDEVYENSTTDAEYNKSITKQYTDVIFKRKYINSNNLQKIKEIVKESDVIEVLDCYSWKSMNLLKCGINDSIFEYKFN